jgi:purine-nucleoside phosphorylase
LQKRFHFQFSNAPVLLLYFDAMQNIPLAIQEAVKTIQEKIGSRPPFVGVVLGTGLHAFTQQLSVEVTIPYTDIPHFPASTVEFHKGEIIFGAIEKTPVIVMQGRFHYYEGYSMQQITFPIRVLKALGVEYLLLSNAAGGMSPAYKKGDLVLIEDHINLLPDNPLRGVSDPQLGPRFTDMSAPYDARLNNMMKEAASEAGAIIHSGVYVSVMGPNLETRAEYRWLRSMGADMVGMSTVPEVIVAAQTGLRCAAVSVITDECDPDNLKPVDILEIIEVAGKADQKLAQIFAQVIKKLNR